MAFEVLVSENDALTKNFTLTFSVECTGGFDEAVALAHKRLSTFCEALRAEAAGGSFRYAAGHRG